MVKIWIGPGSDERQTEIVIWTIWTTRRQMGIPTQQALAFL